MQESRVGRQRSLSNSSDDSLVSHRSINHPPAFGGDGNRPVENRSPHDAYLLDSGPPALYQLKTKRIYIEDDKKVRRWTYGRRDRNKQNKVILLVGETGAGKTTVINTMTNYLLGVKFEDQEFYQITEEEKNIDQSVSQTSDITVYEVFVEENPTSLTIIDTPGYGHTEGFKKEREFSEYLGRLFSAKDGIHDIDAVCFVMKASQNRLSGKELYIFNAVLSLFDIENNIVFLLTHSDGGPPTDALNAIEKAQIDCKRDERQKPLHFLFNNQQKENDEQNKHIFKSAWEMGERSTDDLLKLLQENNRKPVQMKVDVLQEPQRLEAYIVKLKERISEEELKMKKTTQIREALIENRDKIQKGENFEFTVNSVVKEKVPTWLSEATSCIICEETCHGEWGCWWVSADDLSKCDVMKDGYCTVCLRQCHYHRHVKENMMHVMKTEDVEMTFHNLKKEHGSTGEIEKSMIWEQEKIKTQIFIYLHEAHTSIIKMSKLQLSAHCAVTPELLDFFIIRLREQRDEKMAKDLKNAGEVIQEKKNRTRRLNLFSFFSFQG